MSDEMPDVTNMSLTCWLTTQYCPACENTLLATNGHLTWCGFCGYSRKPITAPLDSLDDEDHQPDEYHGEGVA